MTHKKIITNSAADKITAANIKCAAAIERHRASFDRFDLAASATDEVLATQEGRKVTKAQRNEYDAAEREAKDSLFDNPPSTLPGLRPYLEYLVKVGLGGDVALSLLESPLFGSPLAA
jgi:hypothetical protein